MSAAKPGAESVPATCLPSHLTPLEAGAIREFVQACRVLLGSDLYEIRLFGSRARGEGHEDSDIDLAVIVTDAGRARRNEVYDLAHDISLRDGLTLAPVVIERARLEHLRRRERLFAADLDREGIPL